MHPITVRQATTADLETLLRFQQGVVDAERPFDATLKDGVVHYYDIESLLRSDSALFLVAESEGRIVGGGFARIDAAKPFLKHAQQAYLGLMYVEPAARGAGIIGRIIHDLKAWCRARNVNEVRLEVYDGNSGALKAYRRAGFTPHMVEMRVSLNDE